MGGCVSKDKKAPAKPEGETTGLVSLKHSFLHMLFTIKGI